ncbi:hypothetical protein N5J52_02205 [Stenotrophomonas maltophilia]|uniref:hypothetical protein n=1 Tax=Stenotrophomonas maltophilia TaxID=40324 RepID=UPI00244747CC|nr:hypothetical protein [Stenotrophomonas maltophilia]MDH2061712.1 hypothetical protein [Stenotrophomonas maltophilia]HEL3010957.1 hypothetical protein [Stenotrophomonas maltophilia]HEL4138826.1 hypothetical protein [Stenotrophomonas maltophilia]
MSEVGFLRDMDASLHAAFALAGMASTGTLIAKKTGVVSRGVRIYVDRDVETIGDLRQFVSGRVEIAYLRSDVEPEQGDHLEVGEAGQGLGVEVFVNAKKLSDDGSRSRWLVARA